MLEYEVLLDRHVQTISPIIKIQSEQIQKKNIPRFNNNDANPARIFAKQILVDESK